MKNDRGQIIGKNIEGTKPEMLKKCSRNCSDVFILKLRNVCSRKKIDYNRLLRLQYIC